MSPARAKSKTKKAPKAGSPKLLAKRRAPVRQVAAIARKKFVKKGGPSRELAAAMAPSVSGLAKKKGGNGAERSSATSCRPIGFS